MGPQALSTWKQFRDPGPSTAVRMPPAATEAALHAISTKRTERTGTTVNNEVRVQCSMAPLWPSCASSSPAQLLVRRL